MSREFRWLARELRPAPVRRRSVLAGLLVGLVRYLPEIVVALGLVWLWAALSDRLGDWPAAIVLVAAGGLLMWWPASRRVVATVLGCVVTRHRLRTALVELRLTSRAGRLPLVLWLAPTPVGERVRLWCRAGMSAEDLADETERLRAACFCRGRAGYPGPAMGVAGDGRRDPTGPARLRPYGPVPAR